MNIVEVEGKRYIELVVSGVQEDGSTIDRVERVLVQGRGILHARMGSEENPATEEDMSYFFEALEPCLKNLDKDTPTPIVTGHLIHLEFIPL